MFTTANLPPYLQAGNPAADRYRHDPATCTTCSPKHEQTPTPVG